MSYLKNVGKSIGYAIPAIIEDKFKDLGQLSKMVANPKEFKTLFKDSVKDMLNDTSSDMNSEIVGPIKKMYGRASKAAKTGNYFRSEKERTASAFEAFGGDFNMDFDFNTDSLESSIDDSTEATYENTNAIYESGVMQVATTTRATKSITSELSRLSSLTYELSKLQTELTRTQISEAGRYYASSLGFLGDMSDSMSALKNEMVALRMVSAPPDIFKGPNAQKYYEVLTASNFNMRSYFNYLGKKAKDSSAYSMLSMAGMMGSMMDPVEEAVKAMFSPITNSKFGKRMQALNTAIAGSPLFILRSLANKDFGNSFFGKGMSSLFKFLNVDYLDSEKHVSLKTDIRTVPWDAESKRSLVQVIPNLLSRILSAVKKEDFSKEGIIFDPNSGKYIKMQDLGNRMKDTVDKATDFDSFSQNNIIKKMRESQTFSDNTEEKSKQEKSFNNQIYKLLDTARLAGGGNFDINKALDEGKFTTPEEIELAKSMQKQFFSNMSLDKYNNMLELMSQHEERKDNVINTVRSLYTDSKDKFGTAERQFEGNLFDEISKKDFNINVNKIKDSGNNVDNSNNNSNGVGVNNPPINDSFFDKMKKLIDGSYLFTKLNGFLDTISEKTSKFIFGDDAFVGPKKSFFQSLKDGIKEKFDKFSEVFKETFKPLKDYFIQTLIPNLSNAFQGIKKYLVDDIYKGIMGGHTLTGQGGIITNIKESIKGKFNKAKEYLMGTKDDGGNETSEGAFKKIYKSLGFESIFNKFKDGVRSLGDVLKENTEKLAKFFNKHLFEDGGLLKGLGDKISTFFKDTTDSIKKDILNPLKEFLIGDDGILTKAKENIKQNILSPIRDFFIDKDNGIFNDAFKLKFRNTFIQPLEDFFLGKGDNKQNIFKRLMGRLNKDMFFGKEKKYNKNGIQATAGGMFGDSNSFLYKFLFGTSSVDAAGKVNKNTKGLIDNISEKGAGKYLIEKLSETIFKPFSNYLMGDENKPGILRKFATYLDTNIANPIKSFLFGDDEKEGALGKFRNSFNTFLFGDGTDKRKGVIGDYLKPATDFIKVQLLDPFLDTMKNQWTDMKTFFKEGVLEPLITSFDGLGTSIGIKITNLAKEGKGLFVDAFKSTLQVANESIGNMLSSSSKTLTDMMKENVLDPIKSTLDKLRTGMWAVLKGFIKIPINAFSAVTDKIKISNLMKGEGGHLSEAQQARLLEVHNKTAKDKDKKESWGEQKKYFGDNGEEIKKGGIFSSFMDKLHDNRKNREDNANRDSIGKKVTDLNYSEEHKESQKNKQKTLKSVTDSAKIDVTSQNNSFEDIKNLSENSDKSTQSLSELLDVFKNPIPEITTSIKDIKDNVIKYIREHSLTNINDNKAKKDNPSSENKEGDKKNNELKESSKEIKSTNGLLTDIRDGVDTMIYVLRQGLHVGGEGGSNIRGGKNSGGSLGRVLEGLILNPLGMIKSVFEGGFKAITDSIGSVFKVVTEPLIQVTKSIGEGVRSFFKLIGKVGGVVEGLSNLGGKLLTSLGNLIGDVSQGIGTLLKDSAEIFGGIAKDLGSVLSTVVTSTMTVIEGVSEALKPLTEFVFKGIGTILGMITVGVTQSAKVAKAVMKSAGGFLGDVFGIKFGDQSSKTVKAVSIDGGMLTGISDVVRVFVVGGNLDGVSNKVNSGGGMDTNKLSSNNKSDSKKKVDLTRLDSSKKNNLKDTIDKYKIDSTRPDDYKKKKTNNTGGIKDSLINMRDNLTAKLKESRDKLLLLNSDKTVDHLAKIRESGKGLLDLFMLGLPMLISGVGSLISILGLGKVGGFLKSGLGKIGGGLGKVGGFLKSGLGKITALKGLGLGLALTGAEYALDKGMKDGTGKDLATAGTSIAASAATGAGIGALIPIIGPPLGAIAGATYGILTNMNKLGRVASATFHWFAGNEAEFDANGKMTKESNTSIFAKIFGQKSEQDKDGNVISKHEDSILGKVFSMRFWFGDKGLKNKKGQVIREQAEGIFPTIGNFIWDVFTAIPKFLFNTVGGIGVKIKEIFKDGIIKGVMTIGSMLSSSLVSIAETIRDHLNPMTFIRNFWGGDAGTKENGQLLGDTNKGNDLFKSLQEQGNTDSHGFLFKNESISKDAINSLNKDQLNDLIASDTKMSNDTREALHKRVDSLNNPIKRAKGGIVLGKGTETSDSIDAKLSNNEYVLNAKAVKIIGKDNLDKLNRGYSIVPYSKKEDNLTEDYKNKTDYSYNKNDYKFIPYGQYTKERKNKQYSGRERGKSILDLIKDTGIFPWLSDKKGKLINFTSEKIFPWLFDSRNKMIDFSSKNIFPWLSDKAGKMINFTSEKIFPWLSDKASSIGQSISNGVSSIGQGISNVANNAREGAKNIGQSIVTGAKEAYQGAVNNTSQGMTNVADKFHKVSGKFSEQAPQVIKKLMKDFGLKDYQAAAIMGNLGHESGGLKQMQEKGMKSGRGGLGWAQWTGSRRKEFEQLAKETGLPVDSPDLNYMMLKKELSGKYKSTVDKLKGATDLNGSVYAFERGFERSGDVDKAGNIIKTKQYQSRNNYASQALQSLGNNSNIITGDDTQYDDKFVSASLSKSIGSDSPDGLKIKSKEATAGGKAKPGLYSLAKIIQNTIPGFKYFTAFNDGYHVSQGYFSKKGNRNPSTHSMGLALDFTLSDTSKSGEATQKIKSIFSKYGINGSVVNEYAKGSAGSTGGHIHVNFANAGEAGKFQSIIGGKGISEQLMVDSGKSVDSSSINNSVDYSNISSNNPETDKNIAITNASTDVKGLAIKESIDRGNNIAMSNNSTNTIQPTTNLSRVEEILLTIAKNTGETAKKDFSVKVPENGDKKNINLFEGNNTKINPYASYTDNSKMKVMDKRLEQANIIARGQ